MKPSIETATKLAAALEVSLDYLVGIGEMQVFGKSLLRRVEELASLPEQDRQGILFSSIGCLGMRRQGWRISEKQNLCPMDGTFLIPHSAPFFNLSRHVITH
jgi:hypothetical protein